MKGDEKLIITSDEIRIDDSKQRTTSRVMHKGELSLMQKLAEIATKNGGDILEIGFGLHLSADAVQSNPSVTSHTIIEVHPEIYLSAIEWAKDKRNVTVILGDWVKILPTLNQKFDGVLHDTHLDPNLSRFLEYIKPNCKAGTIVAFFDLPVKDSRVNGHLHQLSEEEYQSLPYRSHLAFKSNQFELKYTRFNGTDFEKDKNIKRIL